MKMRRGSKRSGQKKNDNTWTAVERIKREEHLRLNFVWYKLPVFCFRETIPELIQAWMASGDRGRRGKGKREPRRTDSLFFPFRLV